MVAGNKKDSEPRFILVKLKSSHRMCYGRHHDVANHYGISVSQITTNIFRLS